LPIGHGAGMAPCMTGEQHHKIRAGLIVGIGAYSFWGLLPLYLHLLNGVPALQVLAHRILWSVLLLAVIVLATRSGRPIIAAARGRTLFYLAVSALLIAVNWLVYIWAVQNAHVVEASLGYFINPLVNVAFGVALLGERLRRWQGAAIAVAATGVVALAVIEGGAIWISLVLAFSFSTYGVIRKVAAIDALGGLTVETLLLAPVMVAYLCYAHGVGQGVFGTSNRLDLLLALSGVVTAVPLLMFASAARRLRYTTIGLLQFIAPTLQFVEGVTLFGEHVRFAQLAAFVLIWLGCALYAWDSLRAARGRVHTKVR